MSDSISTPVAPAPAAQTPVNAPPPASQQPLSVSDAARLLGRRRAETAQQAAADGAAQPSPSEAIRNRQEPSEPVSRPDGAPDGRRRREAAPADGAPPAPEGPSVADRMAKALGVPEGAAATDGGTAPATDGFEIDGTRHSLDALRSALRQSADYTKKTQALAEQERALRSQAEALAQVLPHIQPELARLQQALEGVRPPSRELAHTDPNRYLHEHAAWLEAQAEQQRLLQLSSLQGQAQQQAMARQVAEANEQLARDFPTFWADPRDRAQAQAEIVQWARTKGGYQDSDLMGLTDARHLRTMIKAMQFDKWVEGAKTAAPASRLASPARGVPPPPAPAESVQRAEDAFSATPNIRTGAALLAARRASSNGSGGAPW